MTSEICSKKQYINQFFEDIKMEQKQLASCEFHECVFMRCSFAETTFNKCRFNGCTFKHSDLSLIQVLDSTFSAVNFENSKVVGVDWTHADWSTARLHQPIGFFKCVINHSTLIGLSLKKLQIRKCTALDVDFREADLSKADFADTDLSESLFTHTNLTEADLSTARNYQINPEHNVLKGAKFSLPEAMDLLYNMDIVLTDVEG